MGWGEVYLGVMFRVMLESKTSSFNDLPSIVKINTKFGMQACMYSMPGCCVSNDWITSTNSHSSPGCGMRWISVIVMNVSLSSVVMSIGSLQYQHVTVGRKACSQNRPNNAFPCVTPLLVKKHILVWQSSNLQAKTLRLQFSCNSALARTFFSQTNPKTKLNYCYGTWHRSLLSFAFPSLQCVVGLFSSVVWTNSYWIQWGHWICVWEICFW